MSDFTRMVHYGPIKLRLIAPPEVIDLVVTSVEPFFPVSADDIGDTSVPVIVAHAECLALEARPDGPGTRLPVDTSLYPHLRSDGVHWDDGQTIHVHIELGDTWVAIDRETQQVEIWQPDLARLAIEVERTLKSLITISSEMAGAIQCHSAAACARDRPGEGTVLLMGDMWQGKTTVLLELLSAFNVDQLSCDTVVIFPPDKAGRQIVQGWPSPFSVSQGTMSDHAELVEFIPADRRGVAYEQRWTQGKKSVFQSADIVKRFNARLQPQADHIRALIVLRFRTDEPVSVCRLDSAAEIEAMLQTVYLGSRDPIYHNWHRWICCDADAIDGNIAAAAADFSARVPVYQVTWSPSVVSLLRRTEPLGTWHKLSDRPPDDASTMSPPLGIAQ